jgi:hypothetical protein
MTQGAILFAQPFKHKKIASASETSYFSPVEPDIS